MQEMLKNYLLAIKDIKDSDKEHTYRSKLQVFLEHIAQIIVKNENIRIIHEPNNDKEGRGAPDFLITKDSLILGYIENKRINAPLDEIAHSDQIKKYFQLSTNIILTDYLRFCLLYQDEKGKIHIKQECRISEYSQLQALIKKPNFYNLDSKAKELQDLFTLFFSHKPSPIITAKEFANALAQRTRILKDEIIENEDNYSIQGLFNAFKDTLYKELEFSVFADNFAQTLTYSLFLSKLNNNTNEKITLDNAYNFIPKSFPLIQAMSKFLRELKALDSIKWLLEEMVAIINHINISEITKDLNKSMQKDLLNEDLHKDPYLHLYEDFLFSYDSRLKELRGVYYTPAPVVRFIIDSIDLVLQKDFNKQGLQSALNSSDITLLDFATGTGTFLLEAFRKALESSNKNSAKYNPKALIQRFYGFELLIAPYTIAHLKISQSFKEDFKAELNDKESLNIMLTNSLYFSSEKDEINKQSNLFGMAELTEEFKKAQIIKEKDILIITGNPPYSGASSNKGLYEDEVRISYGLEPSLSSLTKQEIKSIQAYLSNKSKDKASKNNATTFKSILDKHKLQNEKNPKWLLDDYVKFIRFAERKIERQKGGIFAFISNNAFLDNPTFRGMRYHLLKTFHTIYILDLHGNARKKETTPNGEKDDNVFDIMQGVSINIFVKTPKDSNNLATIYHYDLYGKRKDKYRFLYENNLDSIPWQKPNPQNPFYLFIPQNDSLKLEYDKGWSVRDIFMVSGVGICSKRDKIVFHNSKENLKSMLHDFITKPKDELYRIYDIGEDSRDWKLESAIEAIKENKDNLDEFIQLCHYRPFDYRWTYYINKSRAFMAYPVYEIFKHFLHDSNKALLVARQSQAVGDNEFNAVFASDKIVDLNFYRRGGEEVIPLYVKNSNTTNKQKKLSNPQSKQASQDSKSTHNDIWVENFTKEFRAFIDSKYKEHFSPEVILGYIYAVLFHKEYREKYLDFLKIDFPKIPFVESKEKFLALSDLGLELLNTHLMTDYKERERERENRKL